MDLIVECLIISALSMLGTFLFKIGTNGFGILTFRSFLERDFYNKAFFTKSGWVILFSLLINFVSRIMLMAPLSKGKFGVVMSLLAPLSLALTAAGGYFLFHETYTAKEIFGIALAMIAVWLLT